MLPSEYALSTYPMPMSLTPHPWIFLTNNPKLTMTTFTGTYREFLITVNVNTSFVCPFVADVR